MSDWREFGDLTHAELVAEADQLVRSIRRRLVVMVVLIFATLINDWRADKIDLWATSRNGDAHELHIGQP